MTSTLSDRLRAEAEAMANQPNVTYPSRQAAQHIRDIVAELLKEIARLKILYEATCAVYTREHAAIDILTRERDEARAEIVAIHKRYEELLSLQNSNTGANYWEAEHDAVNARLSEALAVLKEVEWSMDGCCPICGWFSGVHAHDCRLAAVISKAPDGTK